MWIRDGEVSAAVEHAERLATYAQMQKNTVITEQQPERTAAAPVHRRDVYKRQTLHRGGRFRYGCGQAEPRQ